MSIHPSPTEASSREATRCSSLAKPLPPSYRRCQAPRHLRVFSPTQQQERCSRRSLSPLLLGFGRSEPGGQLLQYLVGDCFLSWFYSSTLRLHCNHRFDRSRPPPAYPLQSEFLGSNLPKVLPQVPAHFSYH